MTTYLRTRFLSFGLVVFLFGCAGTPSEVKVPAEKEVSAPTKLDCPASLENSFAALDDMLYDGRSAYEGGFISQQEYDQGRLMLEGVGDRLDLHACERSFGEERAFYLCMNDPQADIAQCGITHNFGVD